MIFYFSGTGNSKFVAERIAQNLGDRIIEMSFGSMKEQITYELAADEKIGFIYPIYWYSMPMMVECYLTNLNFKNYKENYTYAVVTYGNSSGNALNTLDKVLKKRGYPLSGKYGVAMVDNYVVAYDIVNETEQRKKLLEANGKIDVIIENILHSKSVEINNKGIAPFITPVLKPFYTHANHTKKFYSTNDCIKCRQCEIECPCNVIKVLEHGPLWEGNCSFCLKCIHHCPTQAIQYGKGTKERSRYYLDEIKLEKLDND